MNAFEPIGGPTRSRGRAALALVLGAALLVASMPNAALAGGNDADPWVGLNRSIFGFNDTLDHYALEPVAKGYHAVVPDLVEGWIGNFFTNIWFPVVFTNCLLVATDLSITVSFTIAGCIAVKFSDS